jgi:hypothetical protein
MYVTNFPFIISLACSIAGPSEIVVGESSTFRLTLVTENIFPHNGEIQIKFPVLDSDTFPITYYASSASVCTGITVSKSIINLKF